MSDDIKNLIIEALEDQQALFGDTLYENLQIDFQKEAGEVYKHEKKVEFKIAEKVEVNSDKTLFQEDFQKSETLKELYDKIHTCKKCPLGETRNSFVFGTGNPEADVMVIGEAPGAEEDKQGKPFVGRAGKLLTDILKAIKFEREDVFITNILKCRPPRNRDPLPAEVESCRPYLDKQIELIKPKLILCMGRIAANTLLQMKESLASLRGNVYEYNGIRVMATYHPAALLRNPNWKRACWEDVQKFRKLYEDLTGNE